MRRWLSRSAILIGCWTLLGLFSASRIHMMYAAMGNDLAWRRALVIGLCDWYAWAPLAPVVAWLARRFPFEPGGWGRALAVHLPAGVAITVLKMVIEHAAAQTLDYMPQRRLGVAYFHPNFITYLAILGAALALDYHGKYREHQIRASRLEARLAQAQLQVLKMQIQPHFLFNTLHAVSTLMRRDVAAADRMIARLSEMLRLTLDSGSKPMVTLKEELDLIDLYLEILKTRFQDRLAVEKTIDPAALDAQVPNMILQPLVENAVRHGIAPRSEGGRLRIGAALAGGRLTMQVSDDGPGLPPGAAAGDGIGLANTRSRLEAIYGSSQRFALETGDGGGLTVSLEIPARMMEGGDGDRDADRG